MLDYWIDALASSGDNPRHGPLPIHRLQQTPYAELPGRMVYALAGIECQRLEPAADLSGAMAAMIERLAGEGWQAEGSAEYGFTFIRRKAERRLLALTSRDPYDTRSQSFSPFRSTGLD